jgi:hypothetical protein
MGWLSSLINKMRDFRWVHNETVPPWKYRDENMLLFLLDPGTINQG